MLFKRREEEPFIKRTLVHLWPRRSWARSTRYITYRLTRLSATPHVIALGFAAGCFAAVTPFLGFHVIMGALIAWAIGGSLISSFFGTFIGNPLTYPFAWFASYKLGTLILGTSAEHHHLDLHEKFFSASWEQLWPILKPMIVGCVPVGLATATVFYFLMRAAVEGYQERRRRKFHLRQLQRETAVSAQ